MQPCKASRRSARLLNIQCDVELLSNSHAALRSEGVPLTITATGKQHGRQTSHACMLVRCWQHVCVCSAVSALLSAIFLLAHNMLKTCAGTLMQTQRSLVQYAFAVARGDTHSMPVPIQEKRLPALCVLSMDITRMSAQAVGPFSKGSDAIIHAHAACLHADQLISL